MVALKAGTGLSINIRASLGGVEDNTFTLEEVGEAPVVPTTKSITYIFNTVSEDETTETKSYNYTATSNITSEEEDVLKLVGTASRVYYGTKGLKFSSSSKKGELTLETELYVTKVALKLAGYGTDSSNVIVYDTNNNSNESTLETAMSGSSTDVELVLDITAEGGTKSITIEASKATKNRFYLCEIQFEYIPA